MTVTVRKTLFFAHTVLELVLDLQINCFRRLVYNATEYYFVKLFWRKSVSE